MKAQYSFIHTISHYFFHLDFLFLKNDKIVVLIICLNFNLLLVIFFILMDCRVMSSFRCNNYIFSVYFSLWHAAYTTQKPQAFSYPEAQFTADIFNVVILLMLQRIQAPAECFSAPPKPYFYSSACDVLFGPVKKYFKFLFH